MRSLHATILPPVVPALHSTRQPVPVIADDDATREWCAVETPPVARAVGVEAYRRQVDALAAAHPDHGAAQSAAIEAARDRDLLMTSQIADALRDCGPTPSAIAARLIALGWSVRL